jgi:hypothetical protein
MAYQAIGRGSSANDGTGDDLRSGAGKINANFVEVYTKLGDGSTLTSDTVGLLAATQTMTNKTLTAPTINGVVGGTTTSQTITTLTTEGIQNATGELEITAANQVVEIQGGGSNSGAITLNCEQNSHGQKIIAQPHSAGVTNTLTLPAGGNQELVGTTATQTLAAKTLTLPQINDTSSDHQYVFAVSELAADRTVTLPLLAGNDEFVFKDHAVTMTNKTMGAMFGTVQALSGAGAVDITSLITQVTTTGADALTLANGANGQMKIITMVADGGDGTLTPATFANGTTITFNDVGDSVLLVYNTTGGWAAVSNVGCTIA